MSYAAIPKESQRLLILLTLVVWLTSAPFSAAADFASGNLVVLQIGSGGSSLNNNATAVFLKEFTPTGTLVQTLNLPTVVSGTNRRLTNSGTATSEGALTLSANSQFLVIAGYDAAVGASDVAGTTSSSTPRVVGLVDYHGTIDTSSRITNSYNTNNIRSAVSNTGTEFWSSGASDSNSGVRYATTLGGTTTSAISTTVTNTRVINIYNGNLYVSSASGSFVGINQVGAGLPTTSGQTIVRLSGFPGSGSPSPYDFYFANDNTLYVADDRSVASGGGLQKWIKSGSTWTLNYTLTNGLTSGLRGVTSAGGTGNLKLYVISADTLPKFLAVTDAGSSSSSPFTTLATSPSNTAFRGVEVAPVAPPSPCSPDTVAPTIACPSAVIVPAGAGVCSAIGVSLGTPVTNDNCGIAQVSNNAPASFSFGVSSVVWTVTDTSGSTATCSQSVTVQDQQDPSISCPGPIIAPIDTVQCSATGVGLGGPASATDNCTVSNVTNNAPSAYPEGVTIVTWTATDASGNTAACTQSVTITDTTNACSPPALVITEIMYNPDSTEPDWEWVEIRNLGTTAVNLAGYVLDDDDDSVLSSANIASGVVPGGGIAILFNGDEISAANFQSAWGTGINRIPVTNWSQIANEGDFIGLWESMITYGGRNLNNVVCSVEYGDSSPWPSDSAGDHSIYATSFEALHSLADGGLWSKSQLGDASETYSSSSSGGNSGDDFGSPGKVYNPCLADSSPPVTSITSVLPACTNTAIQISWAAADETCGMQGGTAAVLLYVRGPSGPWISAGLPSQQGSSGSFNYSFALGNGSYYFQIVGTDAGGNSQTAPTGSTGTGQAGTVYDTVSPTVTINKKISQPDPTHQSPIVFTAVFTEPVTDFSTSDPSFSGSTASGTLIASISQVAPNDGTAYEVSVSGMTGSGNVVVSIPSGRASDCAGNANASSTSTDNSVAYDPQAPQVVSINRQSPTALMTNAGLVAFRVTFSESVTAVDVSDFTASVVFGGLTGIAAAGTSASSGTTIDVNVTTGTGDGVLRLDLIDNDSISDGAGNALGGAGSQNYTIGQTYTIDRTPPDVLARVPEAGEVVASLPSVQITFSEVIAGLAAGNLTVNGSPAAGLAGAGAGPYTFTGYAVPADGVIEIVLSSGTTQDVAGNALAADNWTYVKNLPPSVNSWASVAHHGPQSAGADIPLLLTGSALNTEPRSGGLSKLSVTFSQDVVPVDALLSSNDLIVSGAQSGPRSAHSITLNNGTSGNILTVEFKPSLQDGDVFTINVAGRFKSAATGLTVAGDEDMQVRVLAGDVNASGLVSFADVAHLKLAIFGEWSSAQHPEADLNQDGNINVIDLAFCKSVLLANP